MSASRPDPPPRVAITENGLRIVGAARDLFAEAGAGPAHALVPGRAPDALFGVKLVLRSGGREPVMPAVLDILTRWIRASGVEVPALEKGVPASVDPERGSGLLWRDGVERRAWSGELVWRAAHPTVRGGRVTHHLVLEERTHFDRLTLRITADDGLNAVRGAVGAGQVRPGWLDEVADRFQVEAWGSPVRPGPLTGLGVEDFVRSTLLGRRAHPVAVQAPLEDGSYVLDPGDVARELMGLAPLYVMERHDTTFRLTDTIGDKRLSCFFGALRIYMPGFTPSDDPFDHPLLVRDRLVDPVMRAAEMGQAAIFVARALEMPDPFGWDPPAPPAEERGADPADVPPPAPATAPPDPEPTPAPATTPQAAPEPEAAAAPTSEPAPPSPDLPEVLALLRQGLEAQAHLAREIGRLTDEVERLRTLTNVRSAGTAMLERQIGRLRDELDARLPAEPAPATPVGDEAMHGDAGEADSPLPPDELLSLVLSASLLYPDELLVLPQAETSALESPYEDPERVGAILDAMASVARRRAAGGLGVPLREAFREFGVDYRGGISETTSARMREQYRFVGPDDREYDCVEHIALGTARDPRYCLRIYFTSRAKAENRFVIGHIGKHFDVAMTD